MSERGKRAGIVVLGVVLAGVVTIYVAAVFASPAAELVPGGRPSGLLIRETAVLEQQGISPANARRAIAVQGHVADANLQSKIEAGLAGAYAGVWFDPPTARLHIGVVSQASHKAAEEVAAHAGLAADVVETPVGSTWNQLLAAQDQWNTKLIGLFARGDAQTALAPELNAVWVTLSSSVPAAERTALEREASASSVKIYVSAAPVSQLSITPEAVTACKAFEEDKAFCDKPITSGVSIKRTGETCTAGPLAIGKGAASGNTYVLTAGHCGSEGQTWFSSYKNEEANEIGKAKTFIQNKFVDYGEILIENAKWKSEVANDPVFADTAEWKVTEPLKSYPVKGERAPMVGNTNCHEGQTSGESCGQIKAVNVTGKFGENDFTEGLVEDKGAISAGGDSGGPWLFIEANNEVRMEGTHVGKNGQARFYEPLKTTLDGLCLELLTTTNEIR